MNNRKSMRQTKVYHLQECDNPINSEFRSDPNIWDARVMLAAGEYKNVATILYSFTESGEVDDKLTEARELTTDKPDGTPWVSDNLCLKAHVKKARSTEVGDIITMEGHYYLATFNAWRCLL